MDGNYFLNDTTHGLFRKDGGSWSFLFFLGSGGGSGALPGDIVNSSGQVVQSAYNNMMYKLMQDEGLAWRFGEAATLAGVEALPERPDAGAINHGGGNDAVFAFGPENNTDPNLYMTVNGTAVGKPNGSVSLANAIAWLQVGAIDRETLQQRPQPPWQNRVTVPPDITYYETINWVEYNDPADIPVFEMRGENGADSPSTRLSFIFTQGSATQPARVVTTGTVTAHNDAMTEFKLGFVPTCAIITAGAEYLLVPGMNGPDFRGEVAVICLGSTSQGSPLRFTAPHERYDWWHGWMDKMQPGFFDQGNVIFMKVLGYLELPSNMKAPTSCAGGTGLDPEAHIDYLNGSINSFALMDSPMADNLPKLRAGGQHFHCYSKGGLMVIASQSEKTVCWIDLGPLFRWTNDMYLEHNAETLVMGVGPTQWPYALEGTHASAMPVVIKTETLTKRPRACWMSPTLNWYSKDDQKRIFPEAPPWFEPDPHYNRVAILTEDGTAYVYGTGRYVPGRLPTLGEAGGPVPSDIVLRGTVTGLGDNVVAVACCKGYPGADDPLNQSFWVADRANRAIRRVALTTSTDGLTTAGSVALEVQDADLDPVGMCQADNYHSTLQLLCVCDHSNSRLRSFRFAEAFYGGDTVWEPAPLINPAKMAERCGDFALAFKPVNVHDSNTP